MKFEFELNEQEQNTLDRLNRGSAIGPVNFLLIVLACFLPSLVGLMYLQMWGVLLVGATIMLMAGLVPALMTLRKKSASPALPRSVMLTPMGLMETHASSRSILKWNHVDDLMEINDGFAFGRHARFTLLPKRIIEQQGESIQVVRDLLARYRNVPERPNEPVELFRERFSGQNSGQVWHYNIERNDLRGLFQSALMPVSETEFAYREVLNSDKKTTNRSAIFLLVLLVLALLLVASSIPQSTENVSLLMAICLVPFMLMVGAAIWLRKRSFRNLPMIRKESYRVGLFHDGWAAGNADVCTFHRWCKGTRFFLSRGFIGFRIESGVINIVPRRAIGENQEVFDFVRLAMKLKQESLLRESGSSEFGDVPMATLSGSDPTDANNPWASPISKTSDNKADSDN